MVDLMTVPWRRSGRTGEDSRGFWFAQSAADQDAFAASWHADPRGHFDKFKTAHTLDALEILHFIGLRRYHVGIGPVLRRSVPIIMEAILDDTYDVVKYYPRHCGGWHALLRIRIPNPSQRVVVVDRPTHPRQSTFVRWPPSGGRGFRQIHGWFTQSIQIAPSAFDVGNSWTPNAEMLQFLAGKRACGGPTRADGRPSAGFEAFASTVMALVYEGYEARVIDFYTRHLRGHGPTEVGDVHHLQQLIHGSSEADSTGLKSILDNALRQELLGFPAYWQLTRSTADLWATAVSAHVEHWRVGSGNHREALTWLKTIVQARQTDWNAAGILDVIGGVRETQRTVGIVASRTLTTTETVMQEVSNSIEEAYRIGTTQAWQTSLSSSITRLDSLTTSQSSGSSTQTGMTTSNETSVMVGGETGALEQLVLGKINGEVTNTTAGSLARQYTAHQEMERAHTTATTHQDTLNRTMTLQEMRERTRAQTRTFRNSVSRAIQLAQGLSTSAQSVINMDANRSAQKTQVLAGLDTALRAINDAIAHL